MAIKMLTHKTGYIESFTMAGVIFSENGVILIDNGWGKKQGEMILNELESIGKKLVAIVNTHTHLDHAGANSFLLERTGCDIYCSLYESLMVRGETQMFASLYAGNMYPIPDGLSVLNNLGPTNPIILEPETEVTIDGVKLHIIGLPGHSDGHIGIVHEDILFCGDAIMGPEAMKMNKLMFISNPPKERETLDRLKKSSYSLYVPSHGKPFKDPTVSCDMVTEMLDNIEGYIFEATKKPVCFDELLRHVANRLDLHLKDVRSYNTAKTTIHTIVNACILRDALDYTVKDNVFIYKELKEGEIREAKKKKLSWPHSVNKE